jgi:sulfatase modifying factor 1
MGSVGFYPEEGPGSARSRWLRDRPRDGYGSGVARFAEEIGYRTLAERPPEAADYPDPDLLLLGAGSAVFRPTPHPVPLYSPECVEKKVHSANFALTKSSEPRVGNLEEASTTLGAWLEYRLWSDPRGGYSLCCTR